MLLSRFQTVGRDLFTSGLVSSSSGNISIRQGDNLIITRRGSMLNCLEEGDLLEMGLTRNNRLTPLASEELSVHRAIYRHTQAQAIVHAHPPHAVALSLTEREIITNKVDGMATSDRIPVIGWDMEVKPGGLKDLIVESLREHRIVMVHGHGSFAIGQLLEEAYNITSALEASCQVLCLLKSLKVNSGE